MIRDIANPHRPYSARAPTDTRKLLPTAEIYELVQRPRLPQPAEARRVLAERGVEVRELARALGVHPVTVSKWLSGRQRPTGARARAYAETIALLSYEDPSIVQRPGVDRGVAEDLADVSGPAPVLSA